MGSSNAEKETGLNERGADSSSSKGMWHPPSYATPPPPSPRGSISGDSIRVQAMPSVLMGHRIIAPQIGALKAECWGVTWGSGCSLHLLTHQYYWAIVPNIGGSGRNRTGVDGFAIRCITTLPPSQGAMSRDKCWRGSPPRPRIIHTLRSNRDFVGDFFGDDFAGAAAIVGAPKNTIRVRLCLS